MMLGNFVADLRETIVSHCIEERSNHHPGVIALDTGGFSDHKLERIPSKVA
jgi:hypothetical protein